MSKTKKLFCFGYGYSCDYLGHELMSNDGWSVFGTTRDPVKQEMLSERGVGAYIFDYKQPLVEPLSVLEGTTHLLISTPTDEEGDPSFRAHVEDIKKISTLEWIGYLSTTGVYGNRDGEWVDETAEVRPTSQRGSRRAIAEDQWLSLLKSDNLPVHIFRLAGIYGPGRSALDSVRAGIARRIEKPGQAFSRIHVEDITQILWASMNKPNPGAIYNVCDDEPAPSHETIAYACELLGRPVPPLVPFDEADLAPITRSFYEDNKRVKNERIKQELGVDLKYKNFREGLKGCLEAEEYAMALFKDMEKASS